MIRRVVVLSVSMVLLGSAIGQAELIGYWPLDEGSGASASDYSPYGHHATIEPYNESIVEWSGDGYQGHCLSFDTVTSTPYTFVDADITPGLLNINSASVALWMNMPTDYYAWGIIVDLISSGEDYSLEPDESGTIWIHGANWFGAEDVPLGDGDWHHITLTFGPDGVVIYIDGVEEASDAGAATDEIQTLRIGGPREHWQPWACFTGLLDEVALYNEVLSADAVNTLYLNGFDKTPKATSPVPSDGQEDVALYAGLSWKPVASALSRNVYFGTDADLVEAATADSTSGIEASLGQSETTYQPAPMDLGQTYYWRVDEVNEDGTVFPGNLWSFTVEPVAFVLDANRITASATSQDGACGPEQTINESGLDADDLHSREAEAMWISGTDDEGPVQIEFTFDQVYTLYAMDVWNSNQAYESALGFGIQEAVIEINTPATGWAVLYDSVILDPAGGTGPTAVTTSLEMQRVQASGVRITAVSSWPGVNTTQYSLSEVRFSYVPTAARLPEPDDGDTDVAVDEDLAWRPGRFAASHEVYFGTDAEALTYVGMVTEPAFDLSDENILFGQTYTWRVDEVNELDAVTSYEGDLWSFSTAEYLVIDDMESYGIGIWIYEAWIDGFEDKTDDNSSQVGLDDPPYVEQTWAYGGDQSMPLYWANNTSSMYATAVKSLDGADWTLGGAETLTMYVLGNGDNDEGELYVQVNSKKVTTDLDLTCPLWTQLDIDLADLGIDLSHVTSLTLGIDGVGEGMVYIDEVRLYRQAPAIAEVADPGSDGLVAYWAMDDGFGTTVTDSAGNNNGTVEGYANWQDGYVGDALQFDGLSDYVDFGAGVSFDLTETMTLSAWVNTTDCGNSEHNPFVGKGDTAYALKHGSGNSLEFYVYEDGSWYTAYYGVGDAYNGSWHHVAGTFDGSQVKLYVDGVLRSSADHDGGIGTNAFELNIARNSEETDRLYEGLIDEVRFYDRALTAGEVRFLAGGE